MRSACATKRDVLVRAFGLALAGATLTAGGSLAQSSASAPARVFVREIRVDPLLVEFGLDTVALRRTVTDLLNEAQRLSRSPEAEAAALDVAVTVPRSVAGGPPDPHALARFEVGRNLMESGIASRLLWERSETIPEHATWRALTGGATRAVVEGVQAFVAETAGR